MEGKEESKTAGSIYPVPAKFVSNLFKNKTVVFVKYTAHETTKLRPGNRIVFYASQGPKELVGEGIISLIEFLPPKDVLAKYRDQLFLNEDEFQEYVNSSPLRDSSKKMLTLMLKSVKKYSNPLRYNRPLTMAGQYFSANEYRSYFLERSLERHE